MQELLYASPSLMNFAYFFLLAVLMLFFVLGFVTYVILA